MPLTATSNAFGFPVLSLLIFLPLAGALLVAVLPRRHGALLHAVGLLVAGLALILATILLASYQADWHDRRLAAFQFADPAGAPRPWLPGGIGYQVGVDGISVGLVFLTALLTALALLFSASSVRARVREYVVLVLVLETGLLGVFAALDLFLFYVFWELVLVPMALLIALWGGRGRVYATVKFVVYTMAGSALMLVAIVATVSASGSPSFHLADLVAAGPVPMPAQMWLFAAFALAFAVKVPLFPLHTWLPDAHVEAPTAGSVLLAGVLLKMGTYGYVRFCLPLFPEATVTAAPFLIALACIGIWYGAWVAFAQRDVKSLVAYSSVSHLGLVVVGLFALNAQGIAGGVLQMISHGLSTGALFLLVGMLYDRARSREIASFGGLWSTMPRYSALFLVVAMASIGLPGTSGFVGEWLSLLGAFQANMLAGAVAAFGVVLGAVFMLWLVQRMFFGPPGAASTGWTDLGPRELAVMVPLVVLILWIGIYPATFLEPIQRTSQAWASWLAAVTTAGILP
jgi:NADH-quinone oxidoreductase subunit M